MARLTIGVVAALVWFPGTLFAQGEAANLRQLEFLQGCWEGSFGGGAGTMEEYYTTPTSNLILGTTRYIRGDQAVQYEFARIETIDGAIVLTPYPNGRPSPDPFTLTSVGDGTAVFESPEHDYPKRIIYQTNPNGTRTARIDGGPDDPDGREWVLERVPCSTND